MGMAKITGFHVDDDGDWVADLDCGHGRHMRHRPPFQNREWVMRPDGRAAMIGTEIDCAKCDQGLPPDGADGKAGR